MFKIIYNIIHLINYTSKIILFIMSYFVILYSLKIYIGNENYVIFFILLLIMIYKNYLIFNLKKNYYKKSVQNNILVNNKINKIIEKTCNLATLSVNNGCGPFGCIITDKNFNIVSKEHNRVTELNDPTAHAEINAIRSACKKINNFNLKEYILFTSCEPCPMCLSAIYWSRIKKIYYSNNREDAKKIGFDDEYFYEQLNKKINERDIIMQRIKSYNSLESFELWNKKNNKISY